MRNTLIIERAPCPRSSASRVQLMRPMRNQCDAVSVELWSPRAIEQFSRARPIEWANMMITIVFTRILPLNLKIGISDGFELLTRQLRFMILSRHTTFSAGGHRIPNSINLSR